MEEKKGPIQWLDWLVARAGAVVAVPRFACLIISTVGSLPYSFSSELKEESYPAFVPRHE